MSIDLTLDKPTPTRGSPRSVYEPSTPDCPLPFGVPHASVKAFYKGCRCAEARRKRDEKEWNRRAADREQSLRPKVSATVLPVETTEAAEAVVRDEERLACIGLDPELFFADGGTIDQHEALATCRRCPVRDACLTAALGRGEAYGVFGGTTAKQRKAMRRRLRQEQAA